MEPWRAPAWVFTGNVRSVTDMASPTKSIPHQEHHPIAAKTYHTSNYIEELQKLMERRLDLWLVNS